MLSENTTYSYELIIDNEVPKDPYKIWNERSKEAQADILVFTNSDVLMAPVWDLHFIRYMIDNAIFTGYLVEPGNVGVASENIHKDFGKTPETFNRRAFEEFTLRNYVMDIQEQRGWYMPCAFRRDWFLGTGGFDTERGEFPLPLDIWFWEKCIKELGTRLYRVKSFAYHFQALSHRGY
jgi:hypothetical protein